MCLAGVVCAAALVAGCATEQTPPPKATLDREPSEHQMVDPLNLEEEPDPDGMQVEGMLGTLDPAAVQLGVEPKLPAVTRCFQQQEARQPYLGGQLTFQFRVSRQGKTKKVMVTQNSVGAYEAERCILDILRTTAFERPRGGEAEFTYSLTFEGRFRPPAWDPSMVRDEILGHIEALLAADPDADQGEALRAPQGLAISFYVDSQGKVVSAGLAAQEPIDPAFAEVFIANLKEIKFIPPQSQYAKVIYQW